MSSDGVVFTGRANVPTSDTWRLDASIPFASLAVSGSAVTLRWFFVSHADVDLFGGRSRHQSTAVASISTMSSGNARRATPSRVPGGATPAAANRSVIGP